MVERISKLFVISLLIFGTSCSDQLEYALKYSESNRVELENVLNYFEAKGDEDALNAAKYIITNMPGHKSMYGRYDDYYDNIDSLFRAGLTSKDTYEVIKELSDSYGSEIGYNYDSFMIDSQYLISNIEKSISQWRDGSWAKHLSFDEFCEWLLPYTCSNTKPLDMWRFDLECFAKGHLDKLNECDDYRENPRAAICCVHDILLGMITKKKWIHESYGHQISRPEAFVKLPGATCEEYAEMVVRILRSKGIPVGIDFTPQWPDRLYGHYWCAYPNLRGKTTMFGPFATNPDYPHYSHTEFAKVYRRTYAPNIEYLSLINKYEGSVPAICRDVFFKDVTNEYMRTVDIKVNLLEGTHLSRKDVYIAVFDNNEWKPVFWGKVRFRKACFKNMGRRITYIVMGYVNNVLVPISHPFYLDAQGDIQEFVSKDAVVQDIRIWRKYPMFQHVFKIHDVLHGGFIEADNSNDFTTSEKVATLPEWPLTSGHEAVKQTKPYRYWRLCAEAEKRCDMAELFFFNQDAELIQPSMGSALADGNPITNYCAEGTVLNEYLDFGKPVNIDRISYVRRGDGNAIIPGDEYDIYYWDDSSWKHHSNHIATDIYIDVKNLSTDILYYIKGRSRGMQHRIFSVTASGEILWR